MSDRTLFKGKNGVHYTLIFSHEEQTIYAVLSDGDMVGELNAVPVNRYCTGAGYGITASMTRVDQAHRRVGVNTAMAQLASEKIPGLQWASGSFTHAGRAWFEAVKTREGTPLRRESVPE